MNRSMIFVTLSAALVTVLSLPACDRPTVVTVPATTSAVPGPAGPRGEAGGQGMMGNQGEQGMQGNRGMQGYQGNEGSQGEAGKSGDATTVIVVPPVKPAN
ncbi:MAG: hypothetical protein PHD37_09725 [Gallionellaceae bacterium]|nr:hypothetical protein [Gallionellaceae bacterium]